MYQLYYWDSSTNETNPVGDLKETYREVEAFLIERYGKRISIYGQDRVDVYDTEQGKVVKYFALAR